MEGRCVGTTKLWLGHDSLKRQTLYDVYVTINAVLSPTKIGMVLPCTYDLSMKSSKL